MMYNSKPIVVNDINFSSIAEASRYYNIPTKNVEHRLKACWTVDEAFGIVKRGHSKVKGKIYIITNSINNKVYIGATTCELKHRFSQHITCSINNTSNTKISKAIRKLGSNKFKIKLIDKANNVRKLGKLEQKYIKQYDSINNGYNTSSARYTRLKVQNILYEGKKYSRFELSKKFNIDIKAIDYRLKNNLDLGNLNRIVYNGIEYESKHMLAEAFNIKISLLYHRLKNNIPLDEVTVRKRKKKPILYNGITYKSKIDLAKKANISISQLNYRLKENIDVFSPVKKYTIQYKGNIYKSIPQLTNKLKLKIKSSTVWYRLKNNIPLERLAA